MSRAADPTGVGGVADRVRSDLAPLPGIAHPSKRVTMASSVEGTLMAVHVREGQRVAAGDLLATIDDRVAQASVNVARAAADRSARVRHAEEELKFAEILAERLLELQSVNGGGDFELLQARTKVEQAKALLAVVHEDQRQAARQLELELARLEAHQIRAPFDGEILRIHAPPGATLTRTDHLLELIRLDELEVELHVPLELFSRLEVGQSYTLFAGPPVNRRVTASLTFAAPVVDTISRSFRCTFTIENPNHTLPAGFSVQLDLTGLPDHDSLATIP